MKRSRILFDLFLSITKCIERKRSMDQFAELRRLREAEDERKRLRNAEHIETRRVAKATRPGPDVGDYIRMKDGTLRRFTHKWDDGIQVTVRGQSGSFYMLTNGAASYSGSLDPSVPMNKIRRTDETALGTFWFFDGERSGAGRGIDCAIPCRVFEEME